MYTVERYHDISCGHRVVGHENKCRNLHGHNYRFHFTCVPLMGLDDVGRVIDFGVIKSKLCEWLEDNWDHKFLMWEKDPLVSVMLYNSGDLIEDEIFNESIVVLPFNPTAENMAAHIVNIIAPQALLGTGALLLTVRLEETRKCAASYSRKEDHNFYVVPKTTCGYTELGETCKRLPNHEGGHNYRGEPA